LRSIKIWDDAKRGIETLKTSEFPALERFSTLTAAPSQELSFAATHLIGPNVCHLTWTLCGVYHSNTPNAENWAKFAACLDYIQEFVKYPVGKISKLRSLDLNNRDNPLITSERGDSVDDAVEVLRQQMKLVGVELKYADNRAFYKR
jgi:hypothetical protein